MSTQLELPRLSSDLFNIPNKPIATLKAFQQTRQDYQKELQLKTAEHCHLAASYFKLLLQPEQPFFLTVFQAIFNMNAATNKKGQIVRKAGIVKDRIFVIRSRIQQLDQQSQVLTTTAQVA